MGSSDVIPTRKITIEDEAKGTDDDAPKKANFETAITAAGYGKFHYLLYLAVIPATWASGFDTSTTSMIIPSAECDFNLSLFHKGVLNAVVYAGMVSSALMWGFIADAFGRKPVVVYGYFVDGFIVNGPYASVMTYCAEFRRTKDRPKVTMVVAFFLVAGSIVGAVLALIIIPYDISINYGGFQINSWQVYLSVCGLPILIGAVCLGFFPESPKFLMSQGRNEKALQVFQQIYSINTGKSTKNYPINSLENEITGQSSLETNEAVLKAKNVKVCVQEGLLQMKPLFVGSYLPRLLLVVTIQFCGMLSTNTIRLWQPQLFAIVGQADKNISEYSFCDIIDQATFSRADMSISNSTEAVLCIKKTVSNSVYINTIIISASSLFFTFFTGALVGSVNNKHLLLICYCVAACSALVLNWSKNTILTLLCISLFVGCLSASVNLVISVVVNLFPTTVRTMAVSLTMMFGRIGSLIGNVMFPIFLQYGCTVALMSLTTMVLVACVLTAFIPKPKESLK